MARKFISFSDFGKDNKKDSVDESAETAKARLDVTKKITEIKVKIQEANNNGDPLGAQMLELDMKMAQLDLQKNGLKAQKDHIGKTKQIAMENEKAREEANKD